LSFKVECKTRNSNSRSNVVWAKKSSVQNQRNHEKKSSVQNQRNHEIASSSGFAYLQYGQIGRIFTSWSAVYSDQFILITDVAIRFRGFLFSTAPAMYWFWQKCVRLHLGDLNHKLIWAPCSHIVGQNNVFFICFFFRWLTSWSSDGTFRGWRSSREQGSFPAPTDRRTITTSRVTVWRRSQSKRFICNSTL
jgi:hypothetical protein